MKTYFLIGFALLFLASQLQAQSNADFESKLKDEYRLDIRPMASNQTKQSVAKQSVPELEAEQSLLLTQKENIQSTIKQAETEGMLAQDPQMVKYQFALKATDSQLRAIESRLHKLKEAQK